MDDMETTSAMRHPEVHLTPSDPMEHGLLETLQSKCFFFFKTASGFPLSIKFHLVCSVTWLLHEPLGSTPRRETQALKVTLGVVSHLGQGNQQKPEHCLGQVRARMGEERPKERTDLSKLSSLHFFP